MPGGASGRRPVAPITRFIPRVTVTFLVGFALFVVVAGLYALPAALESPPPGAIPDYRKERVMARLEGKVTWMLAGSFVAATLIGLRIGGRP